jgi:hypothetical protein
LVNARFNVSTVTDVLFLGIRTLSCLDSIAIPLLILPIAEFELVLAFVEPHTVPGPTSAFSLHAASALAEAHVAEITSCSPKSTAWREMVDERVMRIVSVSFSLSFSLSLSRDVM